MPHRLGDAANPDVNSGSASLDAATANVNAVPLSAYDSFHPCNEPNYIFPQIHDDREVVKSMRPQPQYLSQGGCSTVFALIFL